MPQREGKKQVENWGNNLSPEPASEMDRGKGGHSATIEFVFFGEWAKRKGGRKSYKKRLTLIVNANNRPLSFVQEGGGGRSKEGKGDN